MLLILGTLLLKLCFFLLLVGTLLGSSNIAASIAVGTWVHPSSYNHDFGFLRAFELVQGFWFGLLVIPSAFATGLMLLFSMPSLLRARSVRQHLRWGIRFGAGATILSTFFFLMGGVVYNRRHQIGNDKLIHELVLLPIGAALLGGFFVLIFSPAIAISGCGYGLFAKKLKAWFVTP